MPSFSLTLAEDCGTVTKSRVGGTMIRKLIAIGLCLIAMTVPAVCMGDASEVAESSYWSKLVHEENSLAASVLYLPYLLLQIPCTDC